MIGLVTLLASIRLFSFIDHYAVNLLFWDQWDYYRPIFQPTSFWELFSWQHGPHRQGLGELITYVLAWSSSWNTRLDAFAIGIVLLLSALTLLAVKRSVSRNWDFSDIIIPLTVLSLVQYETLVNTPNLSHSALPLLLVSLYAWSWQISNQLFRVAAILIINFLGIFTGFGFFLGPITIFFFLLACFHAVSGKEMRQAVFAVIALLVVMLSMYIYFIGYHFQPAIECFSITLEEIRKYPTFIGLMLLNFLNIGGPTAGIAKQMVALLPFSGIVWVLLQSSIHLLRTGYARQNRTMQVAFILAGFSFLFCLNTAVGRTCLGLVASQASRYLTITSLSFCGIYIYLLTWKSSRWRVLAIYGLLAVILLAYISPLKRSDWAVINNFHDGKVRWKECYLSYEDVALCNQQAGFAIYPVIDPQIQQGLDFFKARHLNLYLDQPSLSSEDPSSE